MTKRVAIYIGGITLAILLSGCVNRKAVKQLQIQTVQQHKTIQLLHQQADKLQASLAQCKKQKAALTEELKKQKALQKKSTQFTSVSKKYPKPKKNIKLKKVEDTNYSTNYMYPESNRSTKKSKPKPKKNLQVKINKTECIALIGSDKLEKYVRLFGNEADALKRCAIIKALNR